MWSVRELKERKQLGEMSDNLTIALVGRREICDTTIAGRYRGENANENYVGLETSNGNDRISRRRDADVRTRVYSAKRGRSLFCRLA